MGLFLNMLTYFATAVALLLGAIYLFFKKKYSYWADRKVPHVTPTFPWGILNYKKNLADVIDEVYQANKHEPFFGVWMMHRPNLVINDPDLIKRILVQDFSSFPDHGTYANLKDDPLANNLFAMHGSEWRNLRAKLSPTFSSGKMKAMFPILENISNTMIKVVDPTAARGGNVEIKDLIGRFATDVIASCAYGIETNSMENPDSIFRKMGSKIFEPTVSNLIRNFAAFILPDIAKLFRMVTTDKDLSKFFLNVVKENIDYREMNKVERKDFLQLLIQLKNKGVIENIDDKNQKGDPFSFELAAAQAFVFFVGGFETSSGSMQFTLFELAKNQDIQDKLRQEIRDELAKSGGMTYDGIFSLSYMGKIIDETQRKYPQAVFLLRQAKDDYSIPEYNLNIEKGTPVAIPVTGLHHDSRYYPNPEVFDPERFSEEEKENRNKYVYLPFGEGPRFCIGQRFAMMQMRTALFTLINRYKFEFSDKTPKKIQLDPKSFVISPLGGMSLKISLAEK